MGSLSGVSRDMCYFSPGKGLSHHSLLVCMHTIDIRYPESQRRIGFSGVGDIGSCEPYDTGAANEP